MKHNRPGVCVCVCETHAGDLQQVPELSLPLDLHLHHRVVGVLDALQGFLNARKQVDDLLLTDEDLAARRGGANTVKRRRRHSEEEAQTQ